MFSRNADDTSIASNDYHLIGNEEHNHQAATVSAKAVELLVPFCGLLTILTVTGSLPYADPVRRPRYDLRPLLQSLHDTCAAQSLLTLAINFSVAIAGSRRQARPRSPATESGNIYTLRTCLCDSWIGTPVEEFLNYEHTCSLLRGCLKLSAIDFDGVSVGNEGLLALPHSLKWLKLHRADFQAPYRFNLPLLEHLSLSVSDSSSLVRLLNELPDGTAAAVTVSCLARHNCASYAY